MYIYICICIYCIYIHKFCSDMKDHGYETPEELRRRN